MVADAAHTMPRSLRTLDLTDEAIAEPAMLVPSTTTSSTRPTADTRAGLHARRLFEAVQALTRTGRGLSSVAEDST